eukprot:4897639-Prymnesium_polylepis.1
MLKLKLYARPSNVPQALNAVGRHLGEEHVRLRSTRHLARHLRECNAPAQSEVAADFHLLRPGCVGAGKRLSNQKCPASSVMRHS